MIKQNKWKLIIASAVILLPMIVGLIFIGAFPENMPTHWDLWGNADGFSGPVAFVTVIPVVLVLVFWACILITARDNKRKPQNPKVVNMIIALIPFTSLYVSAIMYATAFGYSMNIGAIALIPIGILFIVIGNYLPKCTRNRTVGIRIKWTLANEDNWNKTHRFGGKVSVVLGVVALLAAFLPTGAVPIVMISIITVYIILVGGYSYLYYKKQLAAGEYRDDEDDCFDSEEKSAKKPVIFSVIMTVVVLVFCAVLIFTGKVSVSVGEEYLEVDATYNTRFALSYEDIDSVEYLEEHNAGNRVAGFGSPVIGVGSFENKEFGAYTRYAYTKCKACIVIKSGGKTLVINGETQEATEQIYKDILQKLPTE